MYISANAALNYVPYVVHRFTYPEKICILKGKQLIIPCVFILQSYRSIQEFVLLLWTNISGIERNFAQTTK